MKDPNGSAEEIARLREEITRLQSSLADYETLKRQHGSAIREIEQIKQKYAEDLYRERQEGVRWRKELSQWRNNYAALRLQKGGFGFHTLLFTGIAGFLAGAVLCFLLMYLLRIPGDQFDKFTRHKGFELEYALSTGKAAEAVGILHHSADDPAFDDIRPELRYLAKIINATCSGCRQQDSLRTH